MIIPNDKGTTFMVLAMGFLWLVLALVTESQETYGPPKVYGPWPACNSGPVDL